MTEAAPLEAQLRVDEAASLAYKLALQGPVIHFARLEVSRVMAENKACGFPTLDLRALRTDQGETTRARLAEAAQIANGIIDEFFLAEMAYSTATDDAVERAIAEHPNAHVRYLTDIDGTIAPRMTPDSMITQEGHNIIFRPGLGVAISTQAQKYGLSWKGTQAGDRTLQVVPFTVRPGQESVDLISDQIESRCSFANGNLVDRTRAMSIHKTKEEREAFEKNLSFAQAMQIARILHPELPSFRLAAAKNAVFDIALYERMQEVLAARDNPDGVEAAAQVRITQTVADFLGSLDAWSRDKIPAFAELIQKDIDRGEDIVYAYQDDGITPSLLQHERIYCTQLREEDGVHADARFRLLDDPLFKIETPTGRIALALLEERFHYADLMAQMYYGRTILRAL